MYGPVVILGASGLLGQAVAVECARRGWRSVGLSRRRGVDLGRVTDIASVLAPLQPSLVINAAAVTRLQDCEDHPGRVYALHARLPGLLAPWCTANGVPWVQVSTDHYHCGTHNALHDENAAVQLPNEYARSKYAGEALALTSPQCLVLRTNIVGLRGWRGDPTFVEWACAMLQGAHAFTAYDDVWTSSIEVHQFTRAMFDLQAGGATGLYNLAASEATSKAQFIRALAASLGLSDRHVEVAHRPAHCSPARANAMGLDVRRAETRLGYRLPDAQTVIHALQRTIEEREHAYT